MSDDSRTTWEHKTPESNKSVFHILVRHEPYRELGATYFDRLRHSQSVERLTRRLEQLGYAVHLEPRPAAA